jgi:hypothetical protein
LIVKGESTLHVLNSVLEGVDIVVMDQATVKLDGADFDGTLTTYWDSEAQIEVYDSKLTNSPVISGSSVAGFTNTTLPSIEVENDAVALIYRWIHVNVFDGADYPLEGATVCARFFINDTFWTSTRSDSMGVARLNSLGTILTSSGSSFVGNYKINATYWDFGVPHESEDPAEISVGVMPYTEPLGENATFATLKIPSVLLPDLVVDSSSLWFSPSDVVLNSECAINLAVRNVGNDIATDVNIDFFVNDEFIGNDTIDSITIGATQTASIYWTPIAIGSHAVKASVNYPPEFNERSHDNNNITKTVIVLNYADLQMGPITFHTDVSDTSEITEIAGGELVTVKATITNLGQAPVINPMVNLTVREGDGPAVTVFSGDISTTIRQYGIYDVLIPYQTSEVLADTDLTFNMVVNPMGTLLELDSDNNEAEAVLTVLDMRPDFRISASNIDVWYGANDSVDPVFGRTVVIEAIVENAGGTNPGSLTVLFGLMVNTQQGTLNYVLGTQMANISLIPGFTGSKMVSINYTINITAPGTYPLYVSLDPAGIYNEKNESNNNASISFEIEELNVFIKIVSDLSDEYDAGDSIYPTVEITYDEAGDDPVKNLPGVYMELISVESGTVEWTSDYLKTNEFGNVVITLEEIPEVSSGDYEIVIRVAGLDDTVTQTITVHGEVSGVGIPWFIWVAVIVAIVGVVAGFTIYTYVRGLGKLVECGECGEFIPAASKRCPKCGVEFEAGTMKCSECGAWVPAESPECPNCGVKFVGEELGEGDYAEKMRAEYDEMVSKYREMAKPQLGKKFSDKAFEQWWMSQPSYISFEDWLAKEEERRKGVPATCPVCGTMNPKEATVCYKCGTVLGEAAAVGPPQQRMPPTQPPGGGMPREAPPAQQPAETAEYGEQQPPQAAQPKMVIRRPIDRKVVPKKIIRSPPGGSGGSENNEEQQ